MANATSNQPRRAFRPAEVARSFGISERLVRAMVADGRLVSVKIGAARLIPASEIERLLEAKEA